MTAQEMHDLELNLYQARCSMNEVVDRLPNPSIPPKRTPPRTKYKPTDPEMTREPYFMALMSAAHSSGAGHLEDTMWMIFQSAKWITLKEGELRKAEREAL